jgi:hypothetical protein
LQGADEAGGVRQAVVGAGASGQDDAFALSHVCSCLLFRSLLF